MALGMVLGAVTAAAQGTEAMPFLRINRDAAANGMGFAGVASTSRIAYSSFSNSAMIPFGTQKGSVGASFQGWAPNGEKSTNIAFGAAMKAGSRLGFSLGGVYQGGEPYDVSDATGTVTGNFKPKDIVVGGGLGCRLTDNLSAGANVRYASMSLATDASISAVAADVFLACRLSDLSLAAGVSSIGSSVTSSTGESFSLPASVTFGADYSRTFSDIHGIELALDADYFLKGSFSAAFGAQYSFKDMIFARAGYHLGTGSCVLPSFMTVGLGAKFVGINIDFAYLTANDVIGNTLTVGLGYSF